MSPMRTLAMYASRSSSESARSPRRPQEEPMLSEISSLPGTTIKDDCDDSGALVGIRYAKFSIGSMPGMKHAVFIPDNLPLTPETMQQVCFAIGEEMPCMLLQGIGSMCHPGNLTTPQLRACSGFGDLLREAKHNLGIEVDGKSRGCWCGSTEGNGDVEAGNGMTGMMTSREGAAKESDDSKERQNQAIEEFANKVLEKRLANTTTAIAKAAAQSNVWIMVGPLITPLEVAMLRSQENGNGEDDVFKMACVHMQDRAYMESKHAKELLRQLFAASEAMSPRVVEDFVPAALPGDLWTPRKNGTNKQFYDHGFDWWSFQNPADKEAGGHPLLVFPWPCADLFLFFYREDIARGSGCLPEADWNFQTSKRHDVEAVPWHPELLAPPGCIFIGGEPRSKQKVMQMMQASGNMVFIDNTPSITKQMSLFMNIIKKVVAERSHKSALKDFVQEGALNNMPAIPQAAQLLSALSPSKILKYIEKEYTDKTMPQALKLSLSDVVCILDLVKQRPQVFRDSVAVINPLADESDSIVTELANTFCANYSSCINDPKSSQASKNLIMKGWRLHSKLRHSAAQLRFLAITLAVIIAMFLFGCTVIAVVIVHIKFEKHRLREELLSGYNPKYKDDAQGDDTWLLTMSDAFSFWMLIMPVSAGLLLILQNHFQFAQKWAAVYLAEQQVVSEIFLFLGSCGRYSGSVTTNHQNLLRRLEMVVTNLAAVGIQEKDFLSADSIDALSSDKALSIHINRSLYDIKPPSWFAAKVTEALQSCGLALAESSGTPDRDVTMPASAEVYMEERVMPLMKYYNSVVKNYMRARILLYVCVFCLLASCFFLTAFGNLLFIPITVEASHLCTSFIHWLTPPEATTALSNAIAALHKMDLRWHASTTKQQRSEAMHRRITTLTEKVALAVGMAISQAPLVGDNLSLEEDDDEPTDDEMQPQQSLKTSRSRQISQPGTPRGQKDMWSRSFSRKCRSGTSTPGGRSSGF